MGMNHLNFQEITLKKLMDMFCDMCSLYWKVVNTSSYHENEFLHLEKKKSYGKTWGVYYLHLWLDVHDNSTIFIIRSLPSEEIIDSTQSKLSFKNNVQYSNTISNTKNSLKDHF